MRISGTLNRPYALVLATIFLTSISPINSEIAAADVLPINMGVAGQFSLLAPTITIGGAISVYSAIGALSVASATGEAAVTDPLVAKHFGDPTYVAAMEDLTSAISGAFSDTATAIPATVLDAQTFVPGRYYFSAQEVTTAANAVITLDASSNPSGVYIFMFPGNFTPGATVHVMGNADPRRVFWIAQGNFTLGGASSIWLGNVLAGGNITLGNSDIVIGRTLSMTAVTTDASQILPALTTPNFTISRSVETGTVGSPITPVLMVNVESSAVTYSISPVLPLGISLNTSTGELSGTPSESKTATAYTITATKGDQNATQTLQLTIYPAVEKSSPTITSVVPISGSTSGGDTITITGTDFRSGATVSVGGSSCTVSSITGIEIACLTSSGLSGSVDVVVTNNDGGVATASNKFTFVVPGDMAQSALSLTIIGGSAGSPISLLTSGGSGSGAVTYVVDSGTATGCVSNTVDSSTASLTSTSPGTCWVTATKARALSSGSVYYASISSPSVAFTFIGLRQETLTITSTSGTFGTPLSLATTGGTGGGSVTYAVDNGSSTGCLITGGKLTADSSGTCRVTATKAASGNYALESSVQTYVTIVNPHPALTITFSDQTLMPGTVGASYSDYLRARTFSDGAVDSHTVTYALASGSSAFPSGLVLDTATGSVSGSISSTVLPGTFNLLFTASSPGYTSVTTSSLSYLIVTAAPVVNPGGGGGGGGGGGAPAPVLTVAFTDQTLKNATIGTEYSDFLFAHTLSNGSTDSHVVTYALAAGSSRLPSGLVLDTATGVVSGTISSTVSPGTFNLLFTASSPDYTPVTSTSASYMIVLAASSIAVVPKEATTETVTPVETITTQEPVTFTKKLLMTALFGNNSAQLDLKTQSAMRTMAVKIKKMKIESLTVVGYSSSTSGVDNLKLSAARAKSVAAFLVSNGVKTKISVKGLGVIASSGTKSALSLTRKAEIWILIKS